MYAGAYMVNNLFINLPIKSLEKTKEYFKALGFNFNELYSDTTSTCMIVNKNIFAMLLEESRFREFTSKNLCNAKRSTEVILSLQLSSKEDVDALYIKAIKFGGKEHMPLQESGFIYTKSFLDINNHIWEVFYLEEVQLDAE